MNATQKTSSLPFILDGGIATHLEAYGVALDRRLWSSSSVFEQPDLLKKVHVDFLKNGADIVTTATYQAHPVNLGSRAEECFKGALEIARSATKDFVGAKVAFSCGPFGAVLCDGSEYRGDYNASENELFAFHKDRLQLIANLALDFLAFETIPSLVEIRAICRALSQFDRLNCWVSLSSRNGKTLADGTQLQEAIDLLDLPQIVAVGFNCTRPHFISSLVESCKTPKPWVLYPNSGELWDNGSWTSCSAEAESGLSKDWYQMLEGQRIWGIGGCCRVSPENIREIAEFYQSGF